MTGQNEVARTETDFLVIGGGVGGLFAALLAARRGSVVLITKSALTVSNSAWAQGGIAAAVASDDSPRLHLEDTLRAGRGLCNEKAVEILTCEGPERIRDLEAFGAAFERNEAGYDLSREGGHSRRRVLHADGTATGGHVVNVLTHRVRESGAIRVLEFTTALELLHDDGQCFGVLTANVKTGALGIFQAPRTILSTGGAAGLFRNTTNPPTATGEGIGLAYRAGAEVMDMEFVQFHPTALYSETGQCFLISEAVRGEGAYLLNAAGDRFMLRYHEMGELAPRDVVSLAVHREMKAAKSDWVFLSLKHLGGDFVRRRFPNIHEECLRQGLDITRDLVPVCPAAHYMVGGVRTDLQGRTSLEGLAACGEVAATGVHGANRLASNSLLECLVFAKRAVESASPGPLPADRTTPARRKLRRIQAAGWPADGPCRPDSQPSGALRRPKGIGRASKGRRRALARLAASFDSRQPDRSGGAAPKGIARRARARRFSRRKSRMAETHRPSARERTTIRRTLDHRIRSIVDRALEEDIGSGDPSAALFPDSAQARAVILAKQAGVVAGLQVAEMVFRKLDAGLAWNPCKQDGERVREGETVAELSGNLRAILTGERTALNFLQRMSGIATLTNRFVEAVAGMRTKILDTRKTAPGLRILDKYAVRAGGGFNHRLGLYDGVLLKDNHVRAAGGIEQAVRAVREHVPPGQKIEVEVTQTAEVEEALRAGAEIVLLDNMSVMEMKKAVQWIQGRALVEASGGVTLENVRQIAATGVDWISVGALTHSVKALDLSLEVVEG
jgi:L-aspartate oxidase/nicotinate-nucleotide pyrophosphorylase